MTDRGGNIAFAGSITTSADGRPPPAAILATAAVGDIFLDVDTVNVAISTTLSADAEITTQNSLY